MLDHQDYVAPEDQMGPQTNQDPVETSAFLDRQDTKVSPEPEDILVWMLSQEKKV